MALRRSAPYRIAVRLTFSIVAYTFERSCGAKANGGGRWTGKLAERRLVHYANSPCRLNPARQVFWQLTFNGKIQRAPTVLRLSKAFQASPLGQSQLRAKSSECCRETTAQPALNLGRLNDSRSESVGELPIGDENDEGHGHEYSTEAKQLTQG